MVKRMKNAGKPVDINAFRHLYPFKGQYLDRKGLRYHYLDEGTGDILLMLHGNPTWSFYFRRLVLALRDRYRVIVPDHMGCGLSDKPGRDRYDFTLQSRVADLTALMDQVAPAGGVTLILHDWGGMIGLAWALANKHRLKRVVITNTAGFPPPGGKPIPLRLKLIRNANPLMKWCVLHLNLFARGALLMAPRKALGADVRKGLTAPYNCARNRLATLAFVQDIPLKPTDPGGEIVAAVDSRLEALCKCPVLILWGRHDFVFDLDYFRHWKKRLPHARSYLFGDGGHYLFEDLPDRCIARIREFLNQHPC